MFPHLQGSTWDSCGTHQWAPPTTPSTTTTGCTPSNGEPWRRSYHHRRKETFMLWICHGLNKESNKWYILFRLEIVQQREDQWPRVTWILAVYKLDETYTWGPATNMLSCFYHWNTFGKSDNKSECVDFYLLFPFDYFSVFESFQWSLKIIGLHRRLLDEFVSLKLTHWFIIRVGEAKALLLQRYDGSQMW